MQADPSTLLFRAGVLSTATAALAQDAPPLPESDRLLHASFPAAPGQPAALLVSRQAGGSDSSGAAAAPPLLASGGSPLVLEPQYLEFSTLLPPGASVHGLGEAVAPWDLTEGLAEEAEAEEEGLGEAAAMDEDAAARIGPSPGSRTLTLWSRDRGTPDAGWHGNGNLCAWGDQGKQQGVDER